MTRRMVGGEQTKPVTICFWSAWTGYKYVKRFCPNAFRACLLVSSKSIVKEPYFPIFVVAWVLFLCFNLLVLQCYSVKASFRLRCLSPFPSALQKRHSREDLFLQLNFQLVPASMTMRSQSISAIDQMLYHALVKGSLAYKFKNPSYHPNQAFQRSREHC